MADLPPQRKHFEVAKLNAQVGHKIMNPSFEY
jgi:hypothetical protein